MPRLRLLIVTLLVGTTLRRKRSGSAGRPAAGRRPTTAGQQPTDLLRFLRRLFRV
jgi:hypothetical protein